jgi:hypothetical protein
LPRLGSRVRIPPPAPDLPTSWQVQSLPKHSRGVSGQNCVSQRGLCRGDNPRAHCEAAGSGWQQELSAVGRSFAARKDAAELARRIESLADRRGLNSDLHMLDDLTPGDPRDADQPPPWRCTVEFWPKPAINAIAVSSISGPFAH